MDIVWTSTIFTLIAAIVILVACGVVLLIIGIKNAQKRQARIEGKIDRALQKKSRDKK